MTLQEADAEARRQTRDSLSCPPCSSGKPCVCPKCPPSTAPATSPILPPLSPSLHSLSNPFTTTPATTAPPLPAPYHGPRTSSYPAYSSSTDLQPSVHTLGAHDEPAKASPVMLVILTTLLALVLCCICSLPEQNQDFRAPHQGSPGFVPLNGSYVGSPGESAWVLCLMGGGGCGVDAWMRNHAPCDDARTSTPNFFQLSRPHYRSCFRCRVHCATRPVALRCESETASVQTMAEESTPPRAPTRQAWLPLLHPLLLVRCMRVMLEACQGIWMEHFPPIARSLVLAETRLPHGIRTGRLPDDPRLS